MTLGDERGALEKGGEEEACEEVMWIFGSGVV